MEITLGGWYNILHATVGALLLLSIVLALEAADVAYRQESQVDRPCSELQLHDDCLRADVPVDDDRSLVLADTHTSVLSYPEPEQPPEVLGTAAPKV